MLREYLEAQGHAGGHFFTSQKRVMRLNSLGFAVSGVLGFVSVIRFRW